EERFTDPTIQGAIETYQGLIDEGLFNEDITTATFEDQGAALLDGDAAMVMQVNSFFGQLQALADTEELDQKIGFFPIAPSGNTGTFVPDQANALVAFKTGDADRESAARQLLSYWLGEGYGDFVNAQATVSLQTGVETPADVPEALLSVSDALADSVGSMQASAIANPDLYIYLADMIQGTKTPAEVAEATQAQFEALAKAQGAEGFLDHIRGRRSAPAPPISESHRRIVTTNISLHKWARRHDHPLWFLIPALVVLVVFFVVPTLFNFVYAFTDWSSFKSAIGFAGIDNFVSLFSNGTLLNSLKVTLVYAVLVAVFQNAFGLALALLLERDTRINRAVRVAFFIPVVMSALAVGYIFQALLKPDGALNGILSAFFGTEVAIPWLGSTTWTIVVVATVPAWKGMGLSMLIYLAGLKTISEDVLEAARLDGASRWTMFRSIRFPLLAPAVTFNVATALLGSMNGFDIVQATTEGGPGGTTELLNIFIFRTFGQGLFAQATTMSLVLFLTVTILAFPVIRFLRKREDVL